MKKATSFGFQFLVMIVIAIGFLVVYFVWLQDYRIFSEDLTDYTICKNSNIENAKLRLKIDNQVLDSKRGNKCTTKYLDVQKGDELKETAKSMATCWDMYLEGKEELFETEDNTYCAVCSVLTYENKERVNGLTSYMMENNVQGTQKTYYQYLTNTIVTKEQLSEVKNSQLDELHSLDVTSPQAVIFIMGKNANPGSWTGQSSVVTTLEGGSAGAIAGGVAVGTLLVKSGLGLCVTGFGCTAGAFLITIGGGIGLASGGLVGYSIGSDYNPDTNTRILLWPYTNEDMRKLNCTVLEGKDTLEIKKF